MSPILYFFIDVWIWTQWAAVASGRVTILATHLHRQKDRLHLQVGVIFQMATMLHESIQDFQVFYEHVFHFSEINS
jgi:hypothetical protein